MRLNNFLQGINTRYIPNLIPDNACQYAENVNLATGSLTNIKQLKAAAKASNKIPYYYKGKWGYYNEGSTFAETNEVLYIADGEQLKKTLDGETIYDLVIEGPIYAPSVNATENDGNVGGENISYCYTYYNERDGSESSPSAFSPDITVGEWTTSGSDTVWTGSKTVEVGNIIASTDPQVTHIRVYRKSSVQPNYNLVAELLNETVTIIDNADDYTASIGSKLYTYGYNIKVERNLTPPFNGRYIVAYEGTIFAAGTGKNSNWLYNSESYSPYLWGTGATKFDEEITGVGVISAGILVFTKYKTYILYGSVGSFSKQVLLPSTGCINGMSIRNMSTGCIWQATDGYYLYQNGLSNITYEKLAYTDLKPIISCASDDESYYALQEDGKILVINSRLNMAIYYFTAENCTGIHVGDGKLHCCDGKNLLSYSGDNANIKFTSKQYTEQGISMYKNFKTIYVYSEGNLKMKVYIDNRLAADVKLDKQGLNEVKVDQANRTGYYMWFEIEGQGSVKEIEFIAEARQNGR